MAAGNRTFFPFFFCFPPLEMWRGWMCIFADGDGCGMRDGRVYYNGHHNHKLSKSIPPSATRRNNSVRALSTGGTTIYFFFFFFLAFHPGIRGGRQRFVTFTESRTPDEQIGSRRCHGRWSTTTNQQNKRRRRRGGHFVSVLHWPRKKEKK